MIVSCREKSDFCVTIPYAAFFSNWSSEQQSQIIEKNTYFLIKIILDLIHKRTIG